MQVVEAMQLDHPGHPLHVVRRAMRTPGDGEVVIEVAACGVCRTDLHIVDGDIRGPLPIVPGHEIVGRIIAAGSAVDHFAIGTRVGVPWLGHTCGECAYCRSGAENLCDMPQFTGFTRDGGFATHVIADARFCFAIPDRFGDVEATPLLCAGLIGYRAYRMVGSARRIGFYGFGAAAHILAQIAGAQGRQIFAFTSPHDVVAQDFARSLGCAWAGGSDQAAPETLDAAILFAPVGHLVPVALRAVRKGGTVVCAGIHMSDIPAFPYRDLWEERSICSVANLTRRDGDEFFALIADMPIRTSTTTYALKDANIALEDLRAGKLSGAAVLVPGQDRMGME